MIEFQPNDPFPLLPTGSFSYQDEQLHSAQVDRWLGLQTESTEASLAQNFDKQTARDRNERHWIGLPVSALLTPYTELRFILSMLNPRSEKIVDLGAAYGRLGFVIAQHYPEVSFLGIEVVGERVREGSAALERFLPTTDSHASVSLVEGDLSLSDFTLPPAEIYFLYDYGSADAIEKTLGDLRALSIQEKITVVGRGGATRDAIEKRHPWLSQVVAPQHFPHFSIYRTSDRL